MSRSPNRNRRKNESRRNVRLKRNCPTNRTAAHATECRQPPPDKNGNVKSQVQGRKPTPQQLREYLSNYPEEDGYEWVVLETRQDEDRLRRWWERLQDIEEWGGFALYHHDCWLISLYGKRPLLERACEQIEIDDVYCGLPRVMEAVYYYELGSEMVACQL